MDSDSSLSSNGAFTSPVESGHPAVEMTECYDNPLLRLQSTDSEHYLTGRSTENAHVHSSPQQPAHVHIREERSSPNVDMLAPYYNDRSDERWRQGSSRTDPSHSGRHHAPEGGLSEEEYFQAYTLIIDRFRSKDPQVQEEARVEALEQFLRNQRASRASRISLEVNRVRNVVSMTLSSIAKVMGEPLKVLFNRALDWEKGNAEQRNEEDHGQAADDHSRGAKQSRDLLSAEALDIPEPHFMDAESDGNLGATTPKTVVPPPQSPRIQQPPYNVLLTSISAELSDGELVRSKEEMIEHARELLANQRVLQSAQNVDHQASAKVSHPEMVPFEPLQVNSDSTGTPVEPRSRNAQYPSVGMAAPVEVGEQRRQTNSSTRSSAFSGGTSRSGSSGGSGSGGSAGVQGLGEQPGLTGSVTIDVAASLTRKGSATYPSAPRALKTNERTSRSPSVAQSGASTESASPVTPTSTLQPLNSLKSTVGSEPASDTAAMRDSRHTLSPRDAVVVSSGFENSQSPTHKPTDKIPPGSMSSSLGSGASVVSTSSNRKVKFMKDTFPSDVSNTTESPFTTDNERKLQQPPTEEEDEEEALRKQQARRRSTRHDSSPFVLQDITAPSRGKVPTAISSLTGAGVFHNLLSLPPTGSSYSSRRGTNSSSGPVSGAEHATSPISSQRSSLVSSQSSRQSVSSLSGAPLSPLGGYQHHQSQGGTTATELTELDMSPAALMRERHERLASVTGTSRAAPVSFGGSPTVGSATRQSVQLRAHPLGGTAGHQSPQYSSPLPPLNSSSASDRESARASIGGPVSFTNDSGGVWGVVTDASEFIGTGMLNRQRSISGSTHSYH